MKNEKIYKQEAISRIATEILAPMFSEVFEKVLSDLINERTDYEKTTPYHVCRHGQ